MPEILTLALPLGVCISTEVVPLNILSPAMFPVSVALPVTVKLPSIATSPEETVNTFADPSAETVTFVLVTTTLLLLSDIELDDTFMPESNAPLPKKYPLVDVMFPGTTKLLPRSICSTCNTLATRFPRATTGPSTSRPAEPK